MADTKNLTRNQEKEAAEYIDDLFRFLEKSPTAYHAVEEMAGYLRDGGFTELYEHKRWQLQTVKESRKRSSYFVRRDNSALIAFTIGDEGLDKGFRMIGAHTDSPALKIKPQPVKSGAGSLVRLGAEVYGGALLHTWFDRDLSLAGRICIKQPGDSCHQTRLIHFDRPILTLPNIAIHLNRDANKGVEVNRQTQLPLIFMQENPQAEKVDFPEILRKRLAELYGAEYGGCEIVSFDLFCHALQPPQRSGLEGEFINAPRLDNLLSCHSAVRAVIDGDSSRNALIFCANHEEVGSLSESGADGNFLQSVLQRIYQTNESLAVSIANSFFISMDNAHATHPNFPEKMDEEHPIKLNTAPVIKYNASQRYSTSAPSAAIYTNICADAGITPQSFVMRSDMPCGSTIGPMTAARLGIRSVDIGAATFAMHSIREMTGFYDPFYCYLSLLSFLGGDYHLP